METLPVPTAAGFTTMAATLTISNSTFPAIRLQAAAAFTTAQHAHCQQQHDLWQFGRLRRRRDQQFPGHSDCPSTAPSPATRYRGFGGGIYHFGDANGGILTISNTNLRQLGNRAVALALGSGGGIHNGGGTVTITSSTISGNTAQFRGGGIISSGTLTSRNTIIALNTCSFGALMCLARSPRRTSTSSAIIPA